jgi:hypothetical protein
MSIIAENGSGLATAESYCSVSFATSYHSKRGNAAWDDLDPDVQEQCLRKATEYIDMRFGDLFTSEKLTTTQALAFPRYDNGFGVLPVVLQRATAEYALRAAVAPLAPDLPFDSTGRLPTKVIEKVGPIDEETSYATRGAQGTAAIFRPYPLADALLKPLMYPVGVYR